MTGDPIDAARARSQLGLVNRVVPARPGGRRGDRARRAHRRELPDRGAHSRASSCARPAELTEAEGWQRTNELDDARSSPAATRSRAPPPSPRSASPSGEHLTRCCISGSDRRTCRSGPRPSCRSWPIGTVGVIAPRIGVPWTRWRVEELARRADVSVDTIRFYQKRRLLPPPDARGPGRLVRARAPRAAGADPRAAGPQGLTLALIGRVLDGDLDATDAPLAAAVAAPTPRRPRSSSRSPSSPSARACPVALLEAVAREGPARRRACTTASERYTTRRHRGRAAGPAAPRTGLPAPRSARARARAPRDDARHRRDRRSRCSIATCARRCARPTSPTTRRPSSSSTRSARCCPRSPRSSRTTSGACCSRSRRSTSNRSAKTTELAAVNVAAASRLESWPT